MAESQRRPVPRVDSGELDTALAFLNFHRESVLKKTEELDDEQLRRVLVDTGTNLLVRVPPHRSRAREWPRLGVKVPRERTTEEVLGDYRAAIPTSDSAIRAIGDPESRLARKVDGKRVTMRWLIAHMTCETARHAGHADILREQIDGTTGR